MAAAVVIVREGKEVDGLKRLVNNKGFPLGVVLARIAESAENIDEAQQAIPTTSHVL